MSEHIQLTASHRSNIGRGGVRKLRRKGKVPAILYGSGDPQPLEVSAVAFIEALQSSESENVLVDLTIEGGKSRLAMVQEVQHHPIKDTVLHVDFHEVRQDQKIQAYVPIHEEGIPDGVKNGGGILDHNIRELHIECLPKDLPSHITVDISHLGLEQALHVKELTLPAGVTAVHDGDLPVFMVHPPRVKTDDGTADGSAAEPEVIRRKKEDADAEK